MSSSSLQDILGQKVENGARQGQGFNSWEHSGDKLYTINAPSARCTNVKVRRFGILDTDWSVALLHIKKCNVLLYYDL